MPCNLLLEILQGGRVTGTGRLINLSPSGACFASNSPLRRGDFVLARLPALRNGINKISGEIVWHKTTPRSTLYGVRLNRSTVA
jgi:hypothetical protein